MSGELVEGEYTLDKPTVSVHDLTPCVRLSVGMRIHGAALAATQLVGDGVEAVRLRVERGEGVRRLTMRVHRSAGDDPSLSISLRSASTSAALAVLAERAAGHRSTAVQVLIPALVERLAARIEALVHMADAEFTTFAELSLRRRTERMAEYLAADAVGTRRQVDAERLLAMIRDGSIVRENLLRQLPTMNVHSLFTIAQAVHRWG